MNVEWDIPMELLTPYGTLPFNDEIGGGNTVQLLLDPARCQTSAGIRLTRDPFSQRDGSIVHREFTEGYAVHMAGWIMADQDTPACAADLRETWETLQMHLHVLLGNDPGGVLTGDNNRLIWTPSGTGGVNRLLGDVRLLEEAQTSFDAGITQFAFALHSRFPYAISITEHTESISQGSSTVLANGGNVPTFPNFKIYGPLAGFAQITNETTGQTFVYDTALPGASIIDVGDYGFVGTFAENMYLNGAGLNLKPGIDVEQSDFWPLVPGNNNVSVDGDTGISIDVIWNDAWY